MRALPSPRLAHTARAKAAFTHTIPSSRNRNRQFCSDGSGNWSAMRRLSTTSAATRTKGMAVAAGCRDSPASPSPKPVRSANDVTAATTAAAPTTTTLTNVCLGLKGSR